MKLVINADDFGMSESINKAVFELVDFGTISSTSVMVNMPFAIDILKLKDRSNISIGLHVNITEGFPVSHPSLCKSLIDEQGAFLEKSILLKRISQNRVDYNDVKREVWGQYYKLKDILGDRNIHFDSHQGSTKIGMVYNALAELVKKENIKTAIRVHSKYYLCKRNFDVKIVRPNIHNIIEFGIRRIIIETILIRKRNKWRNNFITPDGMLFNKDNNTLSIVKDLSSLSSSPSYNGFLEIMCHPATDSNDLNNNQIPKVRVKEYNALKSIEFKRFIKGIDLLNYDDLIYGRY
jgi:predicted glycoside hydrolase/deacetylase ChbG (UPF0249 family)